MKTERVHSILEQVAARNNVSVEEVIREIDAAITEARTDPAAHALWDQLFGAGRVPTAAELITCIAEKMKGC